MSALSYYLEREGILTTGISLVRENTVSLQPPRALWVSFPLGRPLGIPSDPAFQHKVIDAALALLMRERGPVLEDFPLDAPTVDMDTAPACPVSFAKRAVSTDSWKAALLSELQTLQTWQDLGRRRRKGRTLVGVSSLSMQENVEKLGQLLDDKVLPVSELDWFKLAIEDAKVFYLEALTAQPGDYNPEQLQSIFWKETTMGFALMKFYNMFQEDKDLSGFARIVVPRAAIDGPTD